MTSPPEPDRPLGGPIPFSSRESGWPDDPGGEDRLAPPFNNYAHRPVPHTRPRRVSARRRRRTITFATLLAIGLGGLGIAAVGIAHQLLPRQFTPAQQREIAAWEMARRWRALSAGRIFPATVPYTVAADALNAQTGLPLSAQLLAISPQTNCEAAVNGTAAQILKEHHCSAVLRATYVDASGSLVATIAVAVLPSAAAANAAAGGLGGTAGFVQAAGDLNAFPVSRSPAAGFGDADRQLWGAIGAGPYVIMSTAGFADDRGQAGGSDPYLSAEMTSFSVGLVTSAQDVLGRPPRTPVCPGAPGC